jgi:cell surface protein SprA
LVYGFNTHYKSDINKSLWFDTFLNYSINSISPANQIINHVPNSRQNQSFSNNFVNKNKVLTFSFLDTLDQKIDSLQILDSTDNKDDSSVTKIDSVKPDPLKLDSSARVEHFKYKRKDFPFIRLYDGKKSKFYVEPSQGIKRRTTELDSSGKFIIIKEKVGEQITKYVLKIPIDDYLDLKLKTREQEIWDELAYKYELKDTAKKGLSELFKDITNLEIPLPSVGLLSIFGTPKISLNISGAVDIHGAWRNETTEGITASRLGNTRNEPDFKQQVQVNVNGTIGDKLQINADWNTERTFEYENQLKIKYTGYEDEIIQNIEAGNVSLSGSSLVGGGEALFGVKAQFKMGPLNLTTLASQKKGEIKEKSITGGATSQDYDIRAYEYSTNHYFIDTLYASQNQDLDLFNKYYGSSTPTYESRYYVQDIEVWKSIIQYTTNPNERNANVYIDLPSLSSKNSVYDNSYRNSNITPVAGQIETGRFIRLTEGTDYIIHKETGYITFKTQINTNDILAVAYYRINAPGDTLYYGDFVGYGGAAADTSQRLVLKLIKPNNLQPSYKMAWKLLLKNIYPVGGRNIKKDGFTFDIKYEIEGQDPTNVLGSKKILESFKLDQRDASGGSQPDGLFDFREQLTIIPETGEIIFPFLEPFGKNIPQDLPNPDSLKYSDVYDTSVTFARNNKIRDKWIMVGKFSGEASSTYQLGFNLVENSVKVSLNGRELTPGVDYYMDYNIGQLTIKNDAALVPNANLKISYEENDLFQLASKTLLGLRGEIDISRKTKLGFTALNLTQQTLSDKVRIGEEPLSNSIYGVDFSTGADLPFLTRGLDYLISTREMSTFNFRGEFAYMNPDPNTKKSTISSDRGRSIAYIDDFEGSKRTIPVGVGYTSWKDLSVPDRLDSLSPISKLPDSLAMGYKGRSWWYSILPSIVYVKDIWPEKRVAQGEEQVTVLDYVFLPDQPGTYNYQDSISKSSNKKSSWGGMMKQLSSTANNLVDENIEFIEFWLNKVDVQKGSKVYIDLGRISEKLIHTSLIPTQKGKSFHTEDENGNDLIDQGEDNGLDGLTDAEEQAIFNTTKYDPSGDNFGFSKTGSTYFGDYSSINGSEGNAALTDVGRFPDTEDLNRNSYLDNWRDYFRYEIPLDTSDGSGNKNPFIAGGGSKGWYLYRIPLKEFKSRIGTPSFTQVEMIRFFVTNLDTLFHVSIAEFNLVGSQWQNLKPDDDTLKISVISIEDNPGYSSPPGVQREKDRSRPDQDILRNEQSLNLVLSDLRYGSSREAVKYLYKPLDVFSYSEMKLFVHCDNNTEGLDFFFKFGADTNNFYEYRTKLKKNPIERDWTEIGIVFNKITAIKQSRAINQTDTIIIYGDYSFRVKGQPSLTNIKFLDLGVLNFKDSLHSNVSGEVWVNELRVIGADDTPGWSYTVSASVKFADLLNIAINYSQQDPYFHRLSDRFGSRVDSKNWGINSDIDILKLIPVNLSGSNLRMNYSHTEAMGNPLYLPGTDIKVEEAAKTTKNPDQIKKDAQTVTISDSWSASGIKLLIPVDYWLIRDTWNSLTFGFNYSKSFNRNPTVESNKSWIWNANINYGINLSPDYSFYLADIPLLGTILTFFEDYRNTKIYFSPQSFSSSLTAKRNRNVNVTRASLTASSQTTISRDFTSTRGLTINWKLSENGILNLSTSYAVDVASSLTYLETDSYNNQKREGALWWDIWKSGLFGKDYQYNQTIDIRTSPRLPALWDINKYFTLSAGYNVKYQWMNDFRQEELGRSVGYQNRSSIGLTLRLKSLFDPLFPQEEEVEQTEPVIEDTKEKNRERDLGEENPNNVLLPRDTTQINSNLQDNLVQGFNSEVVDTTDGKPKKNALKNALLFLRNSLKFILFDYDNISVSFSNDNSMSSSGVYGTGTGFRNFWAFKYNDLNGPSRLFQIGLSNSVGKRATVPNGNLQDNFTQRNGIDIKTTRPLWEGVKIDLNWKVGWSINKTMSLRSNINGTTSIANVTSSGTIDRSFLSLPPFLIFSVFNSGIKRVNELYNPKASNPNQSLSDAFINGFESFPWLGRLGFLKSVIKYIPRPNWRLSWDGLEKFFIFKSFTQRVSLDHSYTSNYTEGWKINPDGTQVTQSQKINYGFAPLIGLNLTFNQLWEGSFSGNVKYSVTNSYDLGTTTKNITETFSRDIGFSLNYSKTGFEIPLFGLSLKNDIEFSFSYSNTKNSTIIYNMAEFKEEGTPQDGTTRTTMEPRIKYVISSRVTLSIFYRRSSVSPEGAARIPPSSTNEAGLDVRISIQ